MMMTHTLRHDTGETPIMVGEGLLTQGRELWRDIDDVESVFIVSDSNVAPLYLAPLEAVLCATGLRCGHHVLTAGEASKSWLPLQQICEDALAFGCRRRSVMVALGGGVVGDITGVAAALVMRGLRLIHYPSTLMAQSDSAIGGKTAINTAQGKNLAGVFYQPAAVIADISLLQSLDERNMKAGYAELIKYGILGNEDFFAWLEKNGTAVLQQQASQLRHAIGEGVRMKSAIVSDDLHETSGTRALLNLGHTFAHAFEALCGYDDSLLHGEAVAGGLEAALAFSHKKQLCSDDDRQRVTAHIRDVQLHSPWRRALARHDNIAPSLWNAMTFDKKNKGDGIALILTRGIGCAFVSQGHGEEELVSFLNEFLAESLS